MRFCRIGETRPPTTRLVPPRVVQLDYPAVPVKVEIVPDVPSVSATTGAGGTVKVEKDESSTSSEPPGPPDDDDVEDLSPGPAAEDPYLNTAIGGPDVVMAPEQTQKTSHLN